MSKSYKPIKIQYRRNLPHWQNENAVYFVTFRLKGSLPFEKVEELRDRRMIEKETLLQQGYAEKETIEKLGKLHYLYFGQFDDLLDKFQSGPHFLTKPEIASIVSNSILFFDEKRYKVIAYTIMSNHVHLILYKLTKELDSIMGSIKKFSSKQINIQRDTIGQKNWQTESFDHIIRDRSELSLYVTYILNNPIKARLVKRWKDWSYSYVRSEFEYLYNDRLTP